jgi:hypothetical protein
MRSPKKKGENLLNFVAALICLMLTLPVVAQAASIRLPETGQTSCYDASGVVISCAGTGQDGDKQAGVPLPSPRFTDNRNGTVTDNLTGLIWLKNANCTDTAGGIARENGLLDWASALRWSNSLANGQCGLTDNSEPGQWRLPSLNELRSLLDYSRHDRDLPPESAFSNVHSSWYWSSTSNPTYTSGAYNVGMSHGSVHLHGQSNANAAPGVSRVGNKVDQALGVWPVRDDL